MRGLRSLKRMASHSNHRMQTGALACGSIVTGCGTIVFFWARPRVGVQSAELLLGAGSRSPRSLSGGETVRHLLSHLRSPVAKRCRICWALW